MPPVCGRPLSSTPLPGAGRRRGAAARPDEGGAAGARRRLGAPAAGDGADESGWPPRPPPSAAAGVCRLGVTIDADAGGPSAIIIADGGALPAGVPPMAAPANICGVRRGVPVALE